MMNLKIANADCADATRFVKCFERAPSIDVSVIGRPVNEIEIEIVEFHFSHGFVESGKCFFVSEVSVPDFGCDKKFLAWDAGFANALARTCFVAVDGCSVDATVAESDGFFDGGYEFGTFCYFKYAKSEDGHVDSIC